MTAGWLPADTEELFGTEATAEESYDVLTVDVPPASWISALETARDRLGCTYFDWLSAVDEPGTGFRVAAHVVALGPVRRLLLRTTVPHEAPALPTAVGVYAGAAWHERETHEMFGVTFADHPGLDHLLLPENFEGHPLRKDFVLAARVAKAWPGAKEPGESDHGGPRRRQMLPPGVPDPNEWGPLKGQLPAAPSRPARGAGRAAGERPARPAGDRPARRTRTATEGSASQTGSAEAPSTPRRSRTAAEGSASQAAAGAGAPAGAPSAPRRSRTAAEGSASQTAAPDEGASTGPTVRRARSASEGSASQRPTSDAPWHHARPAFDEAGEAEEAEGAGETGEAETARKSEETETEEIGKAGEAGGGKETHGAEHDARRPGAGAAASDEPDTPAKPAAADEPDGSGTTSPDRRPHSPNRPDSPGGTQ
ncbi:NADH-quinone oxidoreductase subunit C [Streptomyces sp. NPDC047853]|uniref:NADH-quinone oxidoreductase subunit C n=1 Tax=unclassified Streptomyces TaxID=2593676 RepID=UPI0034557923